MLLPHGTHAAAAARGGGGVVAGAQGPACPGCALQPQAQAARGGRPPPRVPPLPPPAPLRRWAARSRRPSRSTTSRRASVWPCPSTTPPAAAGRCAALPTSAVLRPAPCSGSAGPGAGVRGSRAPRAVAAALRRPAPAKCSHTCLPSLCPLPRPQGFMWGSLTGFAEPLGGLLGYLVLTENVSASTQPTQDARVHDGRVCMGACVRACWVLAGGSGALPPPRRKRASAHRGLLASPVRAGPPRRGARQRARLCPRLLPQDPLSFAIVFGIVAGEAAAAGLGRRDGWVEGRVRCVSSTAPSLLLLPCPLPLPRCSCFPALSLALAAPASLPSPSPSLLLLPCPLPLPRCSCFPALSLALARPHNAPSPASRPQA